MPSSKTIEDLRQLEDEIKKQDEEIKSLLDQLGVKLDSNRLPNWIWYCSNPECGELNVEGDAKLENCEICGAARPIQREATQPRVAGQWTCESCATENSQDATLCNNCGNMRPIMMDPLVRHQNSPLAPTTPAPTSLTNPDAPPPKSLPRDSQPIPSASDSHKTWICTCCLSPNDSTMNECGVCYADRDKTAGDSDNKRACWACTSSCEIDALECPVCFADLNRTSNWKCEACQSINDDSLIECCVCYAEKPQNLIAAKNTGDKKSWRCQACCTLNDVSATECQVCFADKLPESSWICDACTTLNGLDTVQCSICFADKPSSNDTEIVATATDGTHWVCSACLTSNPIDTEECKICFADREEMSPNANKEITILDISGGKRELLDGRRAQDLLVVGLAPHKITRLVFKTKSFGKEASQVAAKILKTLKNVEEVDFSDIIAGRPTEEALGVLRDMCEALPLDRVRILDLSDNAIGERGMRVLEKTIRSVSNHIEEINFRNNGLSEKSLQLFVDAIGAAPNLRSLHFFSNMCGNGGAIALAPLFEKLGTVKDKPLSFTLSSCRVRTDGMKVLATSLGSVAHRLVSLDLNDSTMGNEGGSALAMTLKACKNLESLSLHDPGLEEPAVSEVVKSIGTLPKLVNLDLQEAQLGKEQTANLIKVLLPNKNLRVLRLSQNEAKMSGLRPLLDKDAFPAMELIDLRDNELKDEFAVAFIETWSNRTSLKSIELGGNDFSADKIHALRRAFGEKLGALEDAED